MNKNKWINKLHIPKDADVVFYQNPSFFRTNSFKKEHLEKSFDELLKKVGKTDIYTISGVANNHHKHSGNRFKICLVKVFLK